MGVQISAGSKFNKIFKAKVSHGDRDLTSLNLQHLHGAFFPDRFAVVIFFLKYMFSGVLYFVIQFEFSCFRWFVSASYLVYPNS